MEKTMESWKLRDEILRSVHQWYFILAFLVIGGLIGFLIAYLVPSPYRATADIYVGIDVVRVNEMEYIIPLAEEEPLNLDDYKNWQLKQVADILTSNWVVEKTLLNLKEQNSAWSEVTRQDLRNAMDIYWYDTGTWQLELVFPDEDQARMGVQTWLDAGHEEISRLLEISTEASELDHQLWSINLAISRNKETRAFLRTFLSSAEEWISTLSELEESYPLESDLMKEFNNWITVYSGENAVWQVSLDDFPQSNQPVESYINWLDDSQSMAKIALDETLSTITVLEEEREELLPAYHQSLNDSLGLSANLVLLPNTSDIAVSSVQSTDTLTLGGAFLGLLGWMLFAVIRIGKTRKVDD
jgi:hypothetical protein